MIDRSTRAGGGRCASRAARLVARFRAGSALGLAASRQGLAVNRASHDWPATVDQAVALLQRLLPPVALSALADLPPHRLVESHFGLGAFIREHFALWAGNPELLKDCARRSGQDNMDADDASMVIVEALWHVLRAAREAKKPH